MIGDALPACLNHEGMCRGESSPIIKSAGVFSGRKLGQLDWLCRYLIPSKKINAQLHTELTLHN